ncbi:MAG: signal peptide peptidase SppA [Treponema sp.]|jgi:protease-4|nr:signal peptide peptidase SppA [Treponema sp.]
MTKKTSGLIIFIVIMALALALVVLSVLSGKIEKPPVKMMGSDYVAVLSITGVIQAENQTYNQEWLLTTIQHLKNDRKNLGILLHIDSPGGAVYEADAVYLALADYAGSGKKLWAYLGSLAASGGYYIACAGDYIIANRNTLTGSIGVISSQSVDLTGLLDRYGVKVTTITAGKNKNMLNFNSPLTGEQREIMQSIADECYEQFVGIVAGARNLPLGDVKTLADGRVYTAAQALKASLIDEIDTFDAALDRFIRGFSGFRQERRIETVYLEYTPKTTFVDFFLQSARSVRSAAWDGNPVTAAIPDALAVWLPPDIRFPAYYYQLK